MKHWRLWKGRGFRTEVCFIAVCWPDCKPEGPLFSAEFVCLSVCLWPALLPFNVDRFWWNLVTRTLLWSSLAATIMVQIGRRGTARRLVLKISKNSQKSQNSILKILVHHFLRLCLLCIVKKFRLDSTKTDGGDTFWSLPLSP